MHLLLRVLKTNRFFRPQQIGLFFRLSFFRLDKGVNILIRDIFALIPLISHLENIVRNLQIFSQEKIHDPIDLLVRLRQRKHPLGLGVIQLYLAKTQSNIVVHADNIKAISDAFTALGQ